MFKFIRNLKRRRYFFKYYNGKKTVYGDPMYLVRKLQYDNPDLADKLQNADNLQEPDTTDVINILCNIFGITKFDPETGVGLTEAEIFQILFSFYNYLEKIKKN